MKYKHLDQDKRDRLEAMLKSGIKKKNIAEILSVHPSTITREIQRNRRRKRIKGGTRKGKYQSGVAHHKAYVRRKYAKYQGKKINEDKDLKMYIIKKLRRYWNPDEISGRMRKERKPFYVSKTAIYEWLRTSIGSYWCKYLYSKRYNVRRRKSRKAKRTLIPNRRGIELRPKGAENKSRYGHYESDTIVSAKKTGSKEALSVVYERKAKYIDARKIRNLKPIPNNNALNDMKKDKLVCSMTFDNGIENTKHEELEVSTYFCDPYSSWQKGGVENANKMIRRFIPKKSDIGDYSDYYVKMVIDILNNKPRKSLGYKTAYEVMVENNLFVKNKKIPSLVGEWEIALRG